MRLFGLMAVLVAATRLEAAPKIPTFSRDVAPILNARCVSCHRPGQIGPMPLQRYSEVRPWAKAIRDEVESRSMPPWRADPKHGRFANDPRLSDREVRTIVAWAEGGAPEGDPATLPKPPVFDSDWRIGAPELELAMPRPFDVPAKGELDLIYMTVDNPLDQDRWISAAEIRPGARGVVHHATVYLLAPAGGKAPPTFDGAAPCDPPAPGAAPRSGDARQYLFSWSPGSPPFTAPKGAGRLLPAHARLLFELHYTTNGKPASDRTRIGLRFAKEVRSRVHTIVAENRAIIIPPGAPDYRASACVELKRPATLLELKPHMHLRGRAMSFTLIEPGGRREILLSVPDWSFDWQLAYQLATPRRLPAGAKILVEARYDNSARNPRNPDPAQEVRWDDWWRAEMLAGMITLVDAGTAP